MKKFIWLNFCLLLLFSCDSDNLLKNSGPFAVEFNLKGAVDNAIQTLYISGVDNGSFDINDYQIEYDESDAHPNSKGFPADLTNEDLQFEGTIRFFSPRLESIYLEYTNLLNYDNGDTLEVTITIFRNGKVIDEISEVFSDNSLEIFRLNKSYNYAD
ncbi:hypothetical protein MWU78_12880 [Arenibacter sp. F26102]|uniref:hypothetical protein n=1 Tax=Arenibacter sp. F26102 TaxID=2926416 RepID=UPI001FF458E7|nr:hypothetical protein [Arenibacter sp. F26102]MCK0146542.1 hypothetical protein [Arenibacter sp. F26102]